MIVKHPLRALAATVALLGLSAVPAAALSSGTYTGKTSQHDAVKAVLSGKMLKKFTITWHAHCKVSNTTLGPLKTFHYQVKLGKSGWSTAGRYTAPSGNGYTEKFSVQDHATFTGKKAKGVFSGTAQIFQNSNSKHVDTCTSGKIHFTLARL